MDYLTLSSQDSNNSPSCVPINYVLISAVSWYQLCHDISCVMISAVWHQTSASYKIIHTSRHAGKHNFVNSPGVWEMCMRSKVVHKNIVHIFSLYMYIGKFGNFWGKFCFVLFFSLYLLLMTALADKCRMVYVEFNFPVLAWVGAENLHYPR